MLPKKDMEKPIRNSKKWAFVEMEREAVAVDNKQADPTRSGRGGYVAKSLSSKSGRESTDGDLPFA